MILIFFYADSSIAILQCTDRDACFIVVYCLEAIVTMTDSVRGWQTSPAALLFTNMRGQIIFVDKQFLRLLKYSEQGLVGAPFHKVLGIEVDMGRKLLQD